ncbi:glycosyltransferase family 2 protein [Leptolyngbya sp. AN02str]|uniref:glycosyltransferase family 2 protein n=1 Tax=Leptolyngbya sp. AN02str TaxID=3423363 RepID=UPI003D317928
MVLLDVLLYGLAAIPLVPIAIFGTECAAALLPGKTRSSQTTTPRFAVLIPAHNEAWGIAATLRELLPQLSPSDRLIVIADNCSDETAAIARECGATVIERQDAINRGKGFALDFGLHYLDADPPDIVVMVDADCRVQSGSIQAIAQLSAATQRPVQAVYLIEQPPNPTPVSSLSALSCTFKNLVRPMGLYRLGQPCLLTGSGMAFPWQVIRHAPLASGNIVEDMQLGLDLAIANASPLLCPEARVLGVLPQQEQAAKSQRTRWEHGHLQTLLTQVPRLFKEAVKQRRLDLLALALDLAVPPLSLVVMLWMAGLLVTAIAGLLGASWWPALWLCGGGLLMFASIVAGWYAYACKTISARRLLGVPFYVLWKVPLYAAFLVRRQTKWVRTERDMG